MLRRLALRDFRNFEKLDVDIPSAGLVIVGENGHGKTNLLEAISYLNLFRSVRGSRDVDVIRFGAPAFHVRAEVVVAQIADSVTVGYERATKRKKAVVQGVEQLKLSNALGALPSVCFSPVDVALVAGGPAERRQFLDVTLALTDASYLHALQQYRAALRQRNAALRTAQRAGARAHGAHDALVSVWEPVLAQHGATLVALRRAWCARHAERFSSLCAAIGERLTVSMRYAGAELPSSHAPTSRHGREASVPSIVIDSSIGTDARVPSKTEFGQDNDANYVGAIASEANEDPAVLHGAYRDAYRLAFDQQRANELRRGITLVGPHRDELQLLLGTRDLRTFGSAGQQRSAAIALRMLELATRREALKEPPLLLLDDPFAELDAKRAARILELLAEVGVGQVILAVPRDEDIPVAFTRLERRTMDNGSLR